MERPEILAALIVSAAGSLFSVWVIFDAWKDLQVSDRGDMEDQSMARLVSEGFRLGIQLMLFVIALIVVFRSDPSQFARVVRLLLIGLPFVVSASSAWSWWSKRRLLTRRK